MSDNNGHESGLTNLFIVFISGAMGLVITLVLAGYAYTWAETRDLIKEKSEWRKEHQQVLDKKFEEVKQNQKELAQRIEQSNDRVQQLLQEVLEGQRHFNEKVGEQKYNQRRDR